MPATAVKRCSKCRTTKPAEEFWRNKSTRDGLQTWCKPCWYEKVTLKQLSGENRDRALRHRRNTHLMRKYGITADEYDAMLVAQGGGCAICHVVEDRAGRVLCVDHDHESGVVRGLLCSNCNQSIGLMHDDAARLRAAANYLEAGNGG